MRRLAVGSVVLVLQLTVGAAVVFAEHESVEMCSPRRGSDRIVCRLFSQPHAITPVKTIRSPRPAPPPAADILYRPGLTEQPDGDFCIAFRREVFPRAADSRAASEAEFLLMRLIRNYPICAGQPRPPTSPSTVAREVIEHIDLPAPTIEIDPGFAITGMTAYLETKGTLHPETYVRPTPLGEITVDADGEYLVDWGDGTPPERYGYEGLAWPEGRITHVYTDIGRYDVVVTVEWVASWSIGERRGTVRDLQTSDRIEDFEVRQLQAVRNR